VGCTWERSGRRRARWGRACAQKHIQDPLPRRISRTRCLGERPSHVVACWLGGAASTSRQLFPALGLRFAFPRGRHHLESHHLGTTFAARGPPCSVPREAPRPRDSGRARIPATVLATAGLGACAGVWWWWWCGVVVVVVSTLSTTSTPRTHRPPSGLAAQGSTAGSTASSHFAFEG
jgi:hypothetical protein